MFTARDAGHKRLTALINEGKPLPIDLKGQTVYYVGPCPKKPDAVIGSCGPTTSGRCDGYTALMLQNGLKGMVGKGWRKQEVIEEMKKQKAVYFAAIGGAGALYADCVKKADLVAFEDLGAEALYLLTVQDLPAIVATDCQGNSIYK
jgi:fumarate hydratase subunit beta